MMKKQKKQDVKGQLIPVVRWGDHYQWPSQAALRHLIKDGETNGFNAVIRRVGRTILIDTDAFRAWVDAQHAANSKPGEGASKRRLRPLQEVPK